MQCIDLFEDQGFYWVLIKDGFAKVIHEDDFAQVHALEDAGWEVIWDSARSPAIGFARAATHGAYPEDEDYKPIIMRTPSVLYRSMSLTELADIFKTGKIVGKGNRFHGGLGENRPWVFFADEMGPAIIYQGEDFSRHASVALDTHPIHGKFADLNALLKEHLAILVQDLRVEMLRFNAANVKAGYKPMDMTGKEDLLKRIANGDSNARRDLMQDLPRQRLQPILDRIRKIEDQQRALSSRFHKLLQDKHNAIKTKLDLQPYSSAVVRTRPLTRGLHFSNAHGRSEMPVDEYGFHPGMVTLADIDRIFLIKAREVVAQGDPATVANLLKGSKKVPVSI